MPKAKRLLHPDFPHHITARTNNRLHFPVPIETAWSIFEDHLYLLNRGFNCEIISFVLMPNHFHLLLRDPELQLSKGMQYFMRETSKEMNRKAFTTNHIWGTKFYSSLIQSLPYYYSAYRYVYQNPVRAGLCNKALDYRFSTLPGLLGRQRLTIPLAEDSTLFDSIDETLHWLDERLMPWEETAIRLSFCRPEMFFSVDPTARKPLEPSGLLTHPCYRKVSDTVSLLF